MTHTSYSAIPEYMAIYPADHLAVEVLLQQHALVEGVDVVTVLQQIRNIAESVCERLDDGAALGDVVFTLNDQLFNVLNFLSVPAADADPAHTMLHRVLERRSGDPLALGILYICVGRWLGLPFGGCDFPGRFLVRYHDELGGVLLDPACGGIQLQEGDLHSLLQQRFGGIVVAGGTQGFTADVNDHHLVVRLLRRLKQAYLRQGQPAQALGVQERLMQLLPDLPGGFRERGRLYEMLECPRAAAEDYSRYLDLAPDACDAAPLQQHLSQLLRQLQTLH
jgi:regulator of sirC expression with transglutaminase-like and TPR domain